jgi:hypothetical protein
MTPLERLQADQGNIQLGAYHRYKVDGKPMPGVTSIIKALDAPALTAWKVRTQVEGTVRATLNNPMAPNEPIEAYIERMKRLANQEFEHERVAREAADEGSQVHALIEWRMRRALGQDVPRPAVSEEAAFREAGWLDWAKSVSLKPIAVEFRLVHRALRYCGTGDLLAEVEGRVALLDWKRGKGVYESHHLQSIGYRMALEEYGFDPMPGYVLLMPPGEDPRLAQCSDSQETRDSFTACLTLYNWTKALAAKARSEAA